MNKMKYIFTVGIISILVFCFSSFVVVPINSSGIISSKKVIVLDAGHGGEDGGAVAKSGVLEKDLNLTIAFKVKEILEKENFKVILTRENDEQEYSSKAKSISAKKKEDIANRIKKVNSSNADLLVSIHMNSFPQEYCKGWHAFYKPNCEKSKKVAGLIQKSILETTGIENSRVEKEISGIKLIDNCEMPAVLIECGFLSNLDEAKKLETDEYQNSIASGICEGIIKAYRAQ